MTEASGGEPTSERPDRRWVDRGPDLGAQVSEGFKTLWKYLAAAAGRLNAAAAADPLSPPPDELVERQDVSGPIVVPAQGYVFGFTVLATLTWSSKGVRPEILSWYAHHFMSEAIQRVRDAAAQEARKLPAHRGGELEVALQRALTEQDPALWSYKRGTVHVKCRPQVSVRLEGRVRQLLQPHWERLIELECQNDLYTRRAQYAERLNRRWVAIMDEFVDHPAPDEAAQAIKEELDRARQHMMAEQKAAAQWSEDLLRERRRHEGIFEPFTAIEIIQQRSQGQDHGTSGQSGEA
ncbi:hypothetical protein NCC78_19705 [Micromonospora phytophila]|uniref:hypothetical protein n=1 Tax=Micromonospora phytophila TaxID=709888 RepID=UPI002030057C|nr:hypothetical protein [Micromonospora phytophila]MCM0676895.1 hypothetical protein [Micromonospora phytophila]